MMLILKALLFGLAACVALIVLSPASVKADELWARFWMSVAVGVLVAGGVWISN